MFLFTVFYLSDYITKSITVDGEEIMLTIADTAAAVNQLYKGHTSWLIGDVDVSWNFKCYIKHIQRT